MADEIVLTVTGGSNLARELAFTLDEPLHVGRSHTAQLRFKEPDVSGKHLEIVREQDGVWVRCLSKNGVLLNGRDRLQTGEMRKLAAGDSLLLGSRASFRVDSISCERCAPEDDEPMVSPEATGMTGLTSETKPLHSVPSVGASYAENPTQATKAVDEAVSRGTGMLNAETTPIDTADMDEDADTPSSFDAPQPPLPPPPPPPPPEANGRGKGTYAESEGIGDMTEAPDLYADLLTSGAGSDTPTPAGDLPTPSGTVAGDATRGLETQRIPTGMIEAFSPDIDSTRRFRQRLMVFVLALFAALLGGVFLEKWINQSEEYLGVPFKFGTKEVDVQSTTFKAADGATEIVVDYPHDPRMHKTESETGVEVTTMTGRDRDCPFRLDFSIRNDPKQLGLSLEQAVAAETERLAGEGYAFMDSDKSEAVSEQERRGFFFFEIANPGSCEVRSGCGLRCFRREYTVTRGKESWWGVFTLFRNGDRLYRLFREIPASQKVRGQLLLLLDANLAIYAQFLERQWESPGSDSLVKGAVQADLEKRVSDLLDKNWPEDWPEVRRALDTLQVLTWGRTDDSRKNVEKLMAEFRRAQAKFYNDQQRKFAVALANGEEEKALQAFRACRGVFGRIPHDLRNHLLNDPKEWKCQQPQ